MTTEPHADWCSTKVGMSKCDCRKPSLTSNEQVYRCYWCKQDFSGEAALIHFGEPHGGRLAPDCIRQMERQLQEMTERKDAVNETLAAVVKERLRARVERLGQLRESVTNARLTWAMACPHECPACDAFYEALKESAPETPACTPDHCERLRDCEVSLAAFDASGTSEYWLRYERRADAAGLAIETTVERTPHDFAIEHGGYLAAAASDFIEASNKMAKAYVVNIDVGQTERQLEADAAYSDSLRRLRTAIYEFNKRADRAAQKTTGEPNLYELVTAARHLAQSFHEKYERFAPEYGHVTREDARSFDPETANGRLMIRVCLELLSEKRAAPDVKTRADLEREVFNIVHRGGLDEPSSDVSGES